jgi:hypothetical protein
MVTSTPDDAPIVDMQFGLAWESPRPGSLRHRRRAARGYRLAISDEDPVGGECTEAIQTFDIVLEPISD